MLQRFFIIYFFLLVTLVTVMGLRGCKFSNPPLELFPDMERQPKYLDQSSNPLFADGRSDRPHVPGAVPTIDRLGQAYDNFLPPGRFYEDPYMTSGRTEDGSFGFGYPIAVNAENMLKGQELYNLYCKVCHGASGDGEGVLKNPRYGYGTIASLLQSRIADQPEGEIFNTITHGLGTMGGYAHSLRPEERWKVVLYVRALQRAANATVDDVPSERRGDLGL